MRRLLRGERQGTIGVVLGLVALICLLGSSLGLTLNYRHELQQTRATLAERCGKTEEFRTAVGEWHAQHPEDPASQAIVDAVNEANRRSCSSAYRSVR